MKVEIEKHDSIVAVRFEGEMDEHSVKPVREKIDECISNLKNVRVMTFDMSKVTFIDSTGLGFVFGRYRKLKEHGVELCLSAVSAPVDKVFATSGVYRYIPIIE